MKRSTFLGASRQAGPEGIPMGNESNQKNSAGKEFKRSVDNLHASKTYSFILSKDMMASVKELCLRENIPVTRALQHLVMNPEFIMAGLLIVRATSTDDDHGEFQVTFSTPSE